MAHEIDTTNGIASFVTARKPAWHRLGQVFDTEMTVPEAQAAAHLAGWNVRKLDLIGRETVMDDDGVTTTDVEDSNWKLVVRDNPITGKVEPLGPVGKNFVHVQNEEQGEFLEALLDMSGARFLTTAGSLLGGRQVFYCAKLPEQMLIGGVDAHDLYVTAMNGHDGSLALSVIASPVRVVCWNTAQAAMASARQRWTTRHTKGATKAIEDARRGLDMTFRFNEAFQAEADRMINETLTTGEFEKIVEGLFPVEDDAAKRTQTNSIERMGIMRGLFADADTQANIRGTRWAGYNAITEYVDHFRPAAGKGDEAKAISRARAALTGDGATLKNEAFRAFRVPATAGA